MSSPASHRVVIERFYPELHAGGFTHNDGWVLFYSRVNALLQPDMTVLDFGAGRGKAIERESGYKLALGSLRGRCARVVGADVDPVVRENPLVDEAVVLEPGRNLPFGDQAFDLILAWAVFEHLDDPAFYAAELARVLKPGGWICAWTPNKYGPVALGARMIPERFHAKSLALLLPDRKEQDTFRTVYRLNTMSALRRHFPPARFRHCSYAITGEPRYHGNSLALAWGWEIYRRVAPQRFASHLHIFLQKLGQSAFAPSTASTGWNSTGMGASEGPGCVSPGCEARAG